MASSTSLKRRNHTVNRSYLRRFANDSGKVARVELPGEKRMPISVRTNFLIGQPTDSSIQRLPARVANQGSGVFRSYPVCVTCN
jgi:hypothetical protein